MRRWLIIKILCNLNKLIRKKDKIVFHSFPDFCDNSKAIYDYCLKIKLNKTYKFSWLVDEVSSYDNIQIENVSFIKRRSLMGLFNYLSAKYVFHTTGLFGNIMPTKKQKIISLWHGMPLKTIGLLDELSKDIYKNFKFSYTVATSNKFKCIMQKAFGCEADKVLVTGQPRNDLLFSDENTLQKIIKTPKNKVILWMPTYRKSSKGHIREEGLESETGLPLLTKENILELDQFLQLLNFVIIIKIHPMQNIDITIKKNLRNIIIIENDYLMSNNIELYKLLGEIDVLLTDYSSVYLDFLIKDKPIGFILNDFEKYSNSRGFVFENPLSMMPGERIYNLEGLMNFLLDINNNIDKHKESRVKINSIVNEFNDNKNCERIIQYLGLKNVEGV
ncbi:CDP-glycerol glycerophosphotransferase family protein [Clostridium tertium]|uniref:CDP-glycerol glycerophosphotransferase family protein n=1 Tax=Clostridium tertium TaxID=1559 RepID=UPI00232C46D3|nr:CDP-glycerol glycerophosphotransferase family protein [Clostridium tertium]MDB1921692.1 CDP-glycerol glycerophosphotransferase family protein [Clostridium tertium]MDB1924895.1 CDP-glycerol glycerophosphotransferase family protein [Clostridium tertium]MDB1929534.1 CDP-glycerol glycerophosphotransferase family protein [Clostridium tertium]